MYMRLGLRPIDASNRKTIKAIGQCFFQPHPTGL
jgi:hypothetical protein